MHSQTNLCRLDSAVHDATRFPIYAALTRGLIRLRTNDLGKVETGRVQIGFQKVKVEIQVNTGERRIRPTIPRVRENQLRAAKDDERDFRWNAKANGSADGAEATVYVKI